MGQDYINIKRTENRISFPFFSPFQLPFLFCHLFEYRHNVFRDLAVLLFRSAAHTNGARDLSIYKKRITACNQCDPWIVCLDRHQRTSLSGAGSHIFCPALGDCRRIRLPWHKGNAQNQRIPVTAVCSGQTVFIADGKADIDPQFPAFFARGST